MILKILVLLKIKFHLIKIGEGGKEKKTITDHTKGFNKKIHSRLDTGQEPIEIPLQSRFAFVFFLYVLACYSLSSTEKDKCCLSPLPCHLFFISPQNAPLSSQNPSSTLLPTKTKSSLFFKKLQVENYSFHLIK